MKILVLLLTLVLSTTAYALKLEYVGETSIKTGTKFQKATIGGLSGVSFDGKTLYALSDDKGRAGDARFFEFDLKIENKAVTLTPTAVQFITGLPKIGEKAAALDPEGLIRLTDGSFVISSEGNNDAKPRVMPRIFQASATGLWMNDLSVPDKYLPELTGKQTKGIQNNAAFEGLTITPDAKFVFTAIESALLQDYAEADWVKGDYIRILKYKNEKGGYRPAQEFIYHIDAFQAGATSKEVFRGVSEILAVSEQKLLVLERGVRVSTENIFSNTVALYLVDLSKGSDVSNLVKISDGKYTPVEKTKILDFGTDLTKERPGKVLQNLEALAWGPKLADGRRSLLVMGDNNFSKKELTELIVFALEGEM